MLSAEALGTIYMDTAKQHFGFMSMLQLTKHICCNLKVVTTDACPCHKMWSKKTTQWCAQHRSGVLTHSKNWSPLRFEEAEGTQGLLQWACRSLLLLAVPKASPLLLQVAHHVSLREGRGSCSHSNYSVPIIIIKYESKHAKIFYLLKHGEKSFGCLLQALCIRCHMIYKNSGKKTPPNLQNTHFSPATGLLL